MKKIHGERKKDDKDDLTMKNPKPLTQIKTPVDNWQPKPGLTDRGKTVKRT